MPLFSILTPALPTRIAQIDALCFEINEQARRIPDPLAIEHLVLLDNKRRTVGEKRDALLRLARGKYVAFVDDDDWIEPDYIREIVLAAQGNPDVITFDQRSEVNGQTCLIHFGLGNPNEPFVPGGEARRDAWHVCAWRRNLAILSQFPAINYGEDWAFAAKLCALPDLRESRIPKILHVYRHDSSTTEAPANS